ncbi:DNA/RNA non-specific endonuclease [Aetokthonos hydrillicola Thurmond2011]|jgi:endonuclease G|uniref:DNA/RNA non-specific endonuclease n=1 Tax=Aetokthonos hydrillicola Thurmond2011 TaxID=2712845 RepID=A0AAP5ICT1_9CYAN|nr:DNA/RNA non-specific endonuclease [Aetokthonos hydrillicola]MBO3462625.1 DNA/RNA non-specific endonuclease [Aetokthonos hydrillicola CCALA 1050]MBW4585757.1 DNA/RNA non-specific endonuclease [Aetokthonos hydrillicola CCALA 1050]MDR9899260.1 DNA/RNA non-specific endonuclease [Aetokthonos hydrillicola Thurmond2011]
MRKVDFFRYFWPLAATLVVVALILVGCSGKLTQLLPTKQAPPQVASVHLILGNPSDATDSVTDADNYLMVKPQYALSYNKSKGTLNWASWQLNKSWLGNVDRQNNFRPDDTLPTKWERVTPSAYIGSGYDKGHVVPSADRTRSVDDNSATFLMTNIMPQTPDNNRRTWEGLESYCRELVVKQGKELYIIAGPFDSQSQPLKGKVTIPQTTWKVIVILDRPGMGLTGVTTDTRVIAVNIPNKQGINPDWTAYKLTVDELEDLTDYNFLSNLAPAIQDVIEEKIDTQ